MHYHHPHNPPYRKSATKKNRSCRKELAAFYADADRHLIENQTYTYQVSALSTAYDAGHGESPLGDPYTVKPLGGIDLNQVQLDPLRLSWSAAKDAEEYAEDAKATLWREAQIAPGARA